ncbi:UNVERIFIED_CONTAM: hypothetical protein FKN15_029326 [Acipenser sinensis]
MVSVFWETANAQPTGKVLLVTYLNVNLQVVAPMACVLQNECSKLETIHLKLTD